MSKQLSKGNDNLILTCLYNLSYCNKDLGDLKNAMKFANENLVKCKEMYKGDHPNHAASL